MSEALAVASRGKLRDITAATLRRMYFDEELSQNRIATALGVTQNAIFCAFKRLGITARTRTDALILQGQSGRFSGPKNPRWNGGVHMHNGYVWVRMPQHRLATRRGYVRQHHLVWEQATGLELPKGWHVHHKNGNKADNRPENLEAMTHKKHRDVLPSLLRRIAELEARVKELEHGR